MCVFYDSRSKRWICRLVINNAEKAEDSDAFSEVEHKHQTPVAVMTMYAIKSLLYMLQ